MPSTKACHGGSAEAGAIAARRMPDGKDADVLGPESAATVKTTQFLGNLPSV